MLLKTLCDMLVVIPDSCGSRNTQKNKNEPKYL